MYYYKVYGLTIDSYKEFNELVQIDRPKEIDIKIEQGIIDRKKLNVLNNVKWLHCEEKFTIFRILNNGYFLIEDGKKITIAEDFTAEEEVIKTFTLGSALGILLYQRKNIAIHGSSIVIDDKAILFTGNSGAGKSSLTNGFRALGYKFLADDVSVINFKEENEIFVNPAYPQQKISKDIIKKMGYDTEGLKLIDEKRGKYIVPLKESFSYRKKALKGIFEIKIGDVEKVSVEKIENEKKINLILKNIYRGEVLLRNKMPMEYFKQVLVLSKNIPIYRIIRPKNKFTVEEQISAVLKILV